MNKRLVSLLAIALLITGCNKAEATEEKAPASRTEITTAAKQAELEPIAVSTAVGDLATPAIPDQTVMGEGKDGMALHVAATHTPYPTYTPYPTFTPLPTVAPPPTETPAVKVTAPNDPAEETDPESTEESAAQSEEPQATSTQVPAPVQGNSTSVNTAQSVELERIDDPDPAPPLTILVSSILVLGDGQYRLTGTIRNDGTETYGGIGVVATFYEQANQCTQREVTRRERDGTERTMTVEDCDYNWHGPVKVYATCQLLEPGAACPFNLKIYPQDYVSYMLHPEGTPVEHRHPASLAVSDLSVVNNGLGYVRMTGMVTNANPFAVRDANIAATLTNAAGQNVNAGSILLPGEMEPGASKSFDLRIEHVPYSSYYINAQATQR